MALLEAYEGQSVPALPQSPITCAKCRVLRHRLNVFCMPDRRYQTLVTEINAKIDRLRSLSSSAAADHDAWASTANSVQRDLEDADEVLAKISMETRRWERYHALRFVHSFFIKRMNERSADWIWSPCRIACPAL